MLIEKATGSLLISQNQKSGKKLGSIFEKLSTGKKINRASDDAAMLSIAQELQKQVRGFRTAQNNIGDAMSALNIQDGASSSVSSMMQRQRELAIQASNGTLNQGQRDALNSEFQALTQEIDRTALSANYNGQSLLDGQSPLSDGTGNIQVGSGATANDQITTNAADMRAATLGVDALDISSAAGASAAISGIDAAQDQVNSIRTSTGATFNRLERSAANASTADINTTYSLSIAEDLDFAKGVSDRTRESILSQTNTAAMRNFHDISRNNVLALLQ